MGSWTGTERKTMIRSLQFSPPHRESTTATVWLPKPSLFTSHPDNLTPRASNLHLSPTWPQPLPPPVTPQHTRVHMLLLSAGQVALSLCRCYSLGPEHSLPPTPLTQSLLSLKAALHIPSSVNRSPSAPAPSPFPQPAPPRPRSEPPSPSEGRRNSGSSSCSLGLTCILAQTILPLTEAVQHPPPSSPGPADT